MTESFFTTPEGLERMKKELQELKTKKRPEVAARIARARELGDLSENAEYAEAQEQASFLEGKIIELEAYINRAVVIGEATAGSVTVRVGSNVKLKSGSQQKNYQIVGSNEADPSAGRISNDTPIARALIGHKAGDTVKVITPAGATEYLIEFVS